jgi:hypothetical protein
MKDSRGINGVLILWEFENTSWVEIDAPKFAN